MMWKSWKTNQDVQKDGQNHKKVTLALRVRRELRAHQEKPGSLETKGIRVLLESKGRKGSQGTKENQDQKVPMEHMDSLGIADPRAHQGLVDQKGTGGFQAPQAHAGHQ
nr:PREDICTED: uncharacterized protein LOC106705167 [Latimeria chalumnae]|eukprot:XP_014349375.1 PREDICTED: uncharacterized protein LOC106705167 [Latimeria chalumnae]